MYPRWLRKLFNKINRWAALKEIDPNDRTSELSVELSVLDPALLTKLDPITSITTHFNSSYKDIETFTRVLNWFCLLDLEQEDYNTLRYGVGSYDVTLERYFFTSAGTRIDPAPAIAQFQLAATNLVAVYREKLMSHDVGTLGHNARLVYAHLAEALKLVHLLRLHYENPS